MGLILLYRIRSISTIFPVPKPAVAVVSSAAAAAAVAVTVSWDKETIKIVEAGTVEAAERPTDLPAV